MTQRVVDVLKLVQVEQQKCRHRVGRLRLCNLDHLVDFTHHALPVQEPGQRVTKRQLFEQRLIALAIGNVAPRTPDAHQLAVFHHAQQRQ